MVAGADPSRRGAWDRRAQADGEIRLQRPQLPPLEAIEAYLARSREARWFSNGGPCHDLLCERLEARTGACAVPVSSGTVGLIAAIAALRDRSPAGSAVALMPSFTFAATAQAAVWNGLRPRLLDIDADSWHLDPLQLQDELARRGGDVAIVIAVSAFGTPPPRRIRLLWEQTCATHAVPLLVDSAAGFGASAHDDRPIGAQGDAEVVSFHATKPFAIGEGGAVFTRDPALAGRIAQIINFAHDARREIAFGLGLNGKMSELHAATALAVLDRIDTIIARRRESARRITGEAGTRFDLQAANERSTWQFVPVAMPTAQARGELLERARGTSEIRLYYEPLHGTPAFRDAPRAAGGLEVTDDLARRIACLPMANDISPADCARLAALLAGG